MNIQELFSGIAVIIDDEVHTGGNVQSLVEQLEEKNIPLLKYNEIPEENLINHLRNVSFIVLDWEFKKTIEIESAEPGESPQIISTTDYPIDFLKQINANIFAPVFIFSNHTKDDIIDKLCELEIYNREKHNYIFVEDKNALQDSIFEKIETWLKATPSVYALKEWDRAFFKARNGLFWSLYQKSPDWPKVLWKTYESDSIDMSSELGEIITKNLHSRIEPFAFEQDILDGEASDYNHTEVRDVLEGERFVSNGLLPRSTIHVGDVFKMGGKYYINIRPQCDCVARGACINDLELYLLKGSAISEPREACKLEDIYLEEYGTFVENDTYIIVYPIDQGKIVRFNFKDLYPMKWSQLHDKRKGRLLPPYITKVQQKYSAYLQRAGLTRTPRNSFQSFE